MARALVRLNFVSYQSVTASSRHLEVGVKKKYLPPLPSVQLDVESAVLTNEDQLWLEIRLRPRSNKSNKINYDVRVPDDR